MSRTRLGVTAGALIRTDGFGHKHALRITQKEREMKRSFRAAVGQIESANERVP
jgi:1,6-anhydro-N-acetylmuramate kinase